ncbi:MAG: TAXI family TRAP transporter solute-binding subunit [Celeribacter sp.]|jgi:TRAP transporter TAXI family solute receptor
MKTIIAAATAVALSFGAAAEAQVASIGTTKGGAIAQIGDAVAAAVSRDSGFQMRPQKMSGTQQYIAAVDMGRVDFGVSNVMQYYMAQSGTGLAEGQAFENLQLVATLVPFTQGIIVRADSDVQSVADLKGLRIPAGYGSSPLFDTFWRAFLDNADLSYEDVTEVPVASLPKSWDAFKQGQVDAVIAAAGSGAVQEMDVMIDGGIRYIPIETSDALLAALPKTRIEPIETSDALVGVGDDNVMHRYEVVLFANADLDEDTVYKTVKAIADNTEDLQASSPLWNDYDPADLAHDYGLEYHPGALRYFREAGLIKTDG